jgi:hypothetical protein
MRLEPVGGGFSGINIASDQLSCIPQAGALGDDRKL